MRTKSLAAAAVVASMVGGAGAGIALSIPSAATAQSSTSSTATATPTPPQWVTDALKKLVDTGTITQAQSDAVGTAIAAAQPARGPGGPGFGHGPHELGDDLAVAAQAIGISQSDLTTALGSGQTLAAVAKAHGVDAQKVIDALVADEKTELADQVKNGTITQAQADQIATGITQRVTDRVNGTFRGPGRDGHGPGGPGFGPDGRGPGGYPLTGTVTSPTA